MGPLRVGRDKCAAVAAKRRAEQPAEREREHFVFFFIKGENEILRVQI